MAALQAAGCSQDRGERPTTLGGEPLTHLHTPPGTEAHLRGREEMGFWKHQALAPPPQVKVPWGHRHSSCLGPRTSPAVQTTLLPLPPATCPLRQTCVCGRGQVQGLSCNPLTQPTAHQPEGLIPPHRWSPRGGP